MSANYIGNQNCSNGIPSGVEALKRVDSIITKANKNITLFKKLKRIQIVTIFILIISIVLMIASDSLPQEITAEEDVYYKPYSQLCKKDDLVKMEILDLTSLYEVTRYSSYSYQSISNTTTSYFYYYLALNPYYTPGYIYMSESALSWLESQLETNDTVTVYGKIIDTPKASDFTNNYITIGDDGYAVETDDLTENNETTQESKPVSFEIQKAIDELSKYKILQIDTDPVFTQTVVVGKGPGSYMHDVGIFLLLFSLFAHILIMSKKRNLAADINYAKKELDKTSKIVFQSECCPNCGNKTNPDEKFCCFCGAQNENINREV